MFVIDELSHIKVEYRDTNTIFNLTTQMPMIMPMPGFNAGRCNTCMSGRYFMESTRSGILDIDFLRPHHNLVVAWFGTRKFVRVTHKYTCWSTGGWLKYRDAT
jgi:hypothetical protein